jgi:DNA-binding GntR family transcriptional regulator
MVQPIFRKQDRTTLKAQAFKQIKQAILSGKLKPGDRLIEAELAEKMGISRFPIREALGYLEKEGLVVTSPFKGTYISQLDEKDLEELYTLRSALEELAIRTLMAKIDKGKIAKLESVLKAMEKAAQKGNVDRLISEDLRFHRTICELSDHRRLLEMWLTLEHQLRSFIVLEDIYKGSDRLLKTHYPVLEAIKDGDGELAEKHIRTHLMEALSLLKEQRKNDSKTRANAPPDRTSPFD